MNAFSSAQYTNSYPPIVPCSNSKTSVIQLTNYHSFLSFKRIPETIKISFFIGLLNTP